MTHSIKLKESHNTCTNTAPLSPSNEVFYNEKLEYEVPAKVILAGEHSVVYGGKALCLPLNSMTLKLSIERTSSSATECFAKKKHINSSQKIVSELISEICDLLNLKPLSINCTLKSSFLIGAGLGSSAALCVLLLRGICGIYNRKISREEELFYSNILEKRFHKTPSGLDTASVAYNKPIHFCKTKGPSPLLISLPQFENEKQKSNWNFAIIDSELRSSTAQMIQIVRPYFKGSHGDKNLEKCDLIVSLIRNSLKRGYVEGVRQGIKQAAKTLEEMQVVSSPLSEIIKNCYNCGALAVKTTGSGGGGCLLALLSPVEEEKERQLQKLRSFFSDKRVFSLNI